MHHWTDRKIRIHAFYCMLGISLLQYVHRQVTRARIRNRPSLAIRVWPSTPLIPRVSAICFKAKEQAEDGAPRNFGGCGLIEIAAQSAAESLDASGVPMGEIGERAIFHFAVFSEGLAEEDGGGRTAVRDGGDVHTYYLSYKYALLRQNLILHDSTVRENCGRFRLTH